MHMEVIPGSDHRYTAFVKSETNVDYAIRSGFLDILSAHAWASKVAKKIEWNRRNLEWMEVHHAFTVEANKEVE